MMSLGLNSSLGGPGTAPPRPPTGLASSGSPATAQAGGPGCPVPPAQQFCPVVASCEPRIDAAICHVGDVICPPMTHESLGHQEEGGRGIIRLSKRG